MLKRVQVLDSLKGVRAGLLGAVARTKASWRDAKSDPERHANLRFLIGSVVLATAAIAAFLWLAGILEWRGSDGDTVVTFSLTCDASANPSGGEACGTAIDLSNRIEAFLDLGPRDIDKDTLNVNLGFETLSVDKPLAPILTQATGLQIISSREFGPPRDGRVTRIDQSWYSTRLQPAAPVQITFARTRLVRYIGLSERELSIRFQFTRNVSFLHGRKTMKLTLHPPPGFEVVEASPPGERASGGRVWTMLLIGDDGDFLFRVRMRDFEAARLDHILDSSAAAVLGVAAGGVISAYVALMLLYRRRDRTNEPAELS
jgi:hypothetical protein